MTIIERIARVLAGQHYSRNAGDQGPANVPGADLVDMHWQDHVNDAIAVLKTLREPDEVMRAAGEKAGGDAGAVWDAMVRAGVGEA